MSNDLISRSELMEGRVENDPVRIAAMCASMSVLEKILEEIEKVASEHPYKVPGKPETYGSYNEAWEDCADRIMGIITGMMEDEKSSDDGWIPVEEGLPENSKHEGAFCPKYQVMTDYGVTEGWYNPNAKGWFVLLWFMTGRFAESEINIERGDVPRVIFIPDGGNVSVSAWQPLPAPYKPKEGDK